MNGATPEDFGNRNGRVCVVLYGGAMQRLASGRRETTSKRTPTAMKFSISLCVILILALAVAAPLQAGDWPQFRGPGGMGVSDDKTIPMTWSETENLQWKLKLPGRGSSSPVVAGDRVFVTCYSGYGMDSSSPGTMRNLKRHLVCVDRATGKIAWEKVVASAVSEDDYRGYIREHGYASSTPVTDGKSVFVLFGKTGVLAFDAKTGTKLWQVNVGRQSNSKRWGSAASPILYKDRVIVSAAEEGRAIFAFDKATGKQVWKAGAGSLELAFGTPTLVEVAGKTELVIAVPGEVWGMSLETGKLQWYAETGIGGNVSPSVTALNGIVFVTGGYPRMGSAAVRAGLAKDGSKDVTKTNTVWKSSDASYVATPLAHDGHLYWLDDRGTAWCLDAKTGKQVYKERLADTVRGSGSGRICYASPILVGGKIYCVSRAGGTYIFDAAPKFKQIALNRFASDKTDFNATPAISNGQMFLRSNTTLYCVAKR